MSEMAKSPERDLMDDATIVRMLKDQRNHVPTEEEVARAHEDAAIKDRIGDWMTVVHQVSLDAVRRIEAKGGLEGLRAEIDDFIAQYEHDFRFRHGEYSRKTIEAAEKLARGIIAALDPPAESQVEAA